MPQERSERDAYTRGVERIAEDRVSKYVGPDAAIEFEKAKAIEQALAGSPFATPKPLSFDRETGRIEFEFVSDARRLQELIEESDATVAVDRVSGSNRAAGAMLGVLHRNLQLHSAARWPMPQFLEHQLQSTGHVLAPVDNVFLHCDYSPVNVLVRYDGQLVVIDAAANKYFTQRADLRGPRYVDLATYTARLYWPYRVRAFRIKWRKLIRRLRHDFILSYEKAAETPIDRVMLRIFERSVLRSRVEWKTKSALVRLPMIAIGNSMMPTE
jgi:hypothetical protein